MGERKFTKLDSKVTYHIKQDGVNMFQCPGTKQTLWGMKWAQRVFPEAKLLICEHRQAAEGGSGYLLRDIDQSLI